LFVPQGVPCGYLSEISCSFRYAATTSTGPKKAGETVPRSRNKTCYDLRKLARTPIEPCPVNIAAFWDIPFDVQAARVVYLTQSALNLMLGVRRRCLGIQYLEGTKPPAFLELAPAVWNAQYFQVSKVDRFYSSEPNVKLQNVVSRAQLIPAISSALGNLMSTQSPVLRRKIESLVPESAAGSGLDKVIDELHRRAQVLLLRSARDQKIKTCLPRAKAQSAHPSGLVLSQEGSSVPDAFTRNDFTDYASLDHIKESLHGQGDSQSHEATSGFADHGRLSPESEGSRGFANYSAGSTGSSGINLGPEEHYMDHDMGGAEWIDYDVASYTSQNLLEYGVLYHENCVGDEIFDLTHGERDYQEQHLQEHDVENAGFYDESDGYNNYYEMSDIEGRLQPPPRAFEDYSAESNRAAGTLGYSGADFSDLVADEDDAIDIGICDDVHEEGIDSDECRYDPCEPNDDYDQGAMLHGDDIDDEPGPNFITGGYAHHNNQAGAAEGTTEVGSRRAPQGWSQVPRGLCVPRQGRAMGASWATPDRLRQEVGRLPVGGLRAQLRTSDQVAQ
jgi:hypothetical protein